MARNIPAEPKRKHFIMNSLIELVGDRAMARTAATASSSRLQRRRASVPLRTAPAAPTWADAPLVRTPWPAGASAERRLSVISPRRWG